MQTFTIKIKQKDFTFTSIFDNKKALARLNDLLKSGKLKPNDLKFANDLISRKALTEKQWPWVHKLVMDYETKTSPSLMKLRRLIGTFQLTPRNEEFALDLLCKSRHKPLTESQMKWVEKLVSEVEPLQLPATLVNPLTKRQVIITINRVKQVAQNMKRDELPSDWLRIIDKLEAAGERFAFKH